MQHSQNEGFVQHSLRSPQVLHMQDARGDDLLDYINKVKVFAYQLGCLEVSMRNEDIDMSSPESLRASYEYLIAAFAKMFIKEFTIE